MSNDPRHIVVVGGGIIGCTIAYYQSMHPSLTASTTITILEASKNGVAQGASGKAGGLVAKWAYPRELVDVSFKEHERLANLHDGAKCWGWRYVNCGSWEGRGDLGKEHTGTGVGKGGQRRSLEKTVGLDGGSSTSRAQTGLPDDLQWVREELTDSYSPMAGPTDTAQVHPYLFTTSILELAKERGVKLIRGKATSIGSADGKVTSVTYVESTSSEERTLAATDVVLAAGAWSPTLVSRLPISATRAHSVTIRTPPSAPIAPYVIFTEITLPNYKRASPEIYARPDGEVYACGPGDSSKLPDTVDDVEVDHVACESVHDHVCSISSELRGGMVNQRQACFLPIVSAGGGPIVGEAKTIAHRLYIATGHTCWGICNAPGTAKALSELIMDGKISCANLKRLEPSKFI